MTREKTLRIRATRSQQGNGTDVFVFFLHGADIARIADINRLKRSKDELEGFQRPEIRKHVNEIVEFLDSGPVLFPNAIILAFSESVSFQKVRGKGQQNCADLSDAGTLSIPIREDGDRVAWIVDGQQRSIALARARNKQIAVPVVAFVSPDLQTQREQFILVNKARNLDKRLLDELLPKVGVFLPKDLGNRKLSSALVDALLTNEGSPFHGLIRRPSNPDKEAVVVDSALTKAIDRSLKAGALAQYRGNGSGPDADAMLKVLLQYWSAVKAAFPDAWGKPATQSRLMHAAGIQAMGALMDQVMVRADSANDAAGEISASLARLAPYCRWTSGVWDELGWKWNEIQVLPQQITRLSEYLLVLDRKLTRAAA
jgi:DGQHR domain-containing protein